MKIEKCVSFEKINTVLREESAIRARDPKLFFDTHFPIKLLDEDSKQLINEDYLYELIVNSHGVAGTRVFLIKGNPGTGKSEFCWYFELKAKEKNVRRKIIHIPKGEVEPGKVAKIFSEAVGLETLDQETYKGQWSVLRKTPETVARQIYYTIINEKYGSPSERPFAKKLKQAESIILEYLTRALRYHISLTEPTAEPLAEHLIESFDKAALEKQLSAQGLPDFDVNLFELEFHKKLEKFLSLPSIEDALDHVSKKFREVRPIVIIEDLVGIGPARTIILNTLSDLYRLDIDLIAGVIPAMEDAVKRPLMKGIEEIELASRELETETFVQRSYDYSLSLESGESTFLNSYNSVIEFIRPYLEHIRTKKCADKTCKHYSNCGELFDHLFPFNSEFIWRIFQILRMEPRLRQDPRTLIKELRKILEEYRNKGIDVCRLATLAFKRPIVFPSEIEKNTELADIVSWYGKIDETEKKVSVRKKLIDTFKISLPKSGIVSKNSLILVDYLYALQPQLYKEIPEPTVPAKEPQAPSRLIRENQETTRWLSGENNVALMALRSGLAMFLDHIAPRPTLLVDESVDRYKAAICWKRKYKGEDIPIVFEGEEKPTHPHVYFDRKEIHDLSFWLTELGVTDNPQRREKLIESIVGKHPEIVPHFKIKIEDCRSEFKKHLEGEMRIEDLDKWIIFAYTLSKMLLLGETDLKNAMSIDDKRILTMTDKPRWLFPDLITRHRDMNQLANCYMALANTITSVGVVKRSEVFAGISEEKMLTFLARSNVPEPFPPFNLNPKSVDLPFKNLVSILKRVSQDLIQVRKVPLSTKSKGILVEVEEISKFAGYLEEKHNLSGVIRKLQEICESMGDPTVTYTLRPIIEYLSPPSFDKGKLKHITKTFNELSKLANNINSAFVCNSFFNKYCWISQYQLYKKLLELSTVLTDRQPKEWKEKREKIVFPSIKTIKAALALAKGK